MEDYTEGVDLSIWDYEEQGFQACVNVYRFFFLWKGRKYYDDDDEDDDKDEELRWLSFIENWMDELKFWKV